MDGIEAIEEGLGILMDSVKKVSNNISESKEELKGLIKPQDNRDVLRKIEYQTNLLQKEIRSLKVHETPQEHKRSVVIFGSADAQITYRWTLLFIGILFFAYLSFKYIPPYLNKKKEIEQTNLVNRKYKDFQKLIYFDSYGNTELFDQHIQDIANSDSTFVSNYNQLLKKYSNEQKRIELEDEKRELEDRLNDLK